MIGQLPSFYNYKPSGRGFSHEPGSPDKPGRDYVFSSPDSLFEFGYGLSYTKFKYSNPKVEPGVIDPVGEVSISVDVRNIGKRRGKEVVQLYVNDVVSSITTPVKALKGFKKTDLKPGEVKTVSFILTGKELSLLNENMEPVVEQGTFEVMIEKLKKTFEVK